MDTAKAVSRANVDLVPIARIVVGERRRKKLGSIGGLSKSIEEHGLIHPILIDGAGHLVAGSRRLEACKKLGWSKIPARRVDRLSDEELRAIELDENVERLDLTAAERSRRIVKQVDEETPAGKSSQSDQSPRGKAGKPPKRTISAKEASEVTGIPETTIKKAQQHTDYLERFRFLDCEAWTQDAALKAGRLLDEMPKADRKTFAQMLGEPGIPSTKALKMLSNLSGMSDDKRDRVRRLYESKDPRERSLARTQAAKLPPMPDPRIELLEEARQRVSRARKLYPDDPFNSTLSAIVDQIRDLSRKIAEAHRRRGTR